MNRFVEFMKKPRNIYLSIVTMMLVVMGLSTISFSYFIEDSTNTNQSFKVNSINTFIQSDDIDSDYITIPAHNSITINVNVINNNDFGHQFGIYYEGDGITATSNKTINDIISEHFVLNYDLTFKNTTNESKTIKLGIVNGYIGTELNVPGTQIK